MFLKLYIIALPIAFVFDMIWLGFISKSFYQSQLGYLMKSNINWTAAILFYLFFVAALIVFVVNPAVAKGSWLNALIFGAFFGFICYATYDLTNQATIKGWPLLVTIVDLAWGTIFSAGVSVITYYIFNKF